MRPVTHFVMGFDADASPGNRLASIHGVGNPVAGLASLSANRLGARSRGGYSCGVELGRAMASQSPRPAAAHERITVKRLRDPGAVRVSHLVLRGQATLRADRPSASRPEDVSIITRPAAARRHGTRAPSRTSHLIDSARLVNPITRLRSMSDECLNFKRGSGSIQVAARRPSSQELRAL